MIEYIVCNPVDIYDELLPLFEANYSDDPRASHIPLDIDTALYDKLYKDGRLVFIAAKEEETFIGYLVAHLSQHQHCKQTTVANFDAVYVLPEYRGDGIFDDLLETAEEILEDAGVSRLSTKFRNVEMAEKVLEGKGYSLEEVSYAKNLGEK